MMRQVNKSPGVAQPLGNTQPQAIVRTIQDVRRTVVQELADHAQRLNGAIPKDGSEAMTGPLMMAPYTVATVPAVASYPGGLIYVTNEIGGATIAYSDGTNWRRVYDNAVVS